MADDNQNNLVRRTGGTDVPAVTPRTLKLGDETELDLSGLSKQQADALEVKAAEKAIDRNDRRQKLKEDIAVTAHKLNTYTKTVLESNAENASVTITNTNDDSLGRTEIIVGNTDAARKGKLSRSQAGLSDTARLWLIFAGIAAVVIVLVAALKR